MRGATLETTPEAGISARMGNEERNLLVRVAAACRILAEDLAKLPSQVADEQFVSELRGVCDRAAERLETIAGGNENGGGGAVAEGH